MKKIIIAALLSLGLLTSAGYAQNREESKITIASFNIRFFDQGPDFKNRLSKHREERPMQIISEIIPQYDIVAVQEVLDDIDFVDLVDRINENQEDQFAYVMSEAIGSWRYKEHYCFAYNTATIAYTGESFVWGDENNLFAREPFAAQFQAGNFDFVLVNIHTKPDNAKYEIPALEQVLLDVDEEFSNDNDVIVIGDFNADGDYFSERIQTGIRDKDIYTWAIPDDFDTNVSGSDRTYDRIVFQRSSTDEDFEGTVGVFRFDEIFNLNYENAMKVSDHFPVWATFYIDKDTD